MYRADLHRIDQNRGEAPERYAARIRQAAPPCCLHTDSGTADYSADLMSSIFILGLSDQYTKEKLFQIPAKAGKSTVEFEELVRAASEIQQAKVNCLEAGGSSVCGIFGSKPSEGKSKMWPCNRCNTVEHSEQGYDEEVRKKLCRAYKAKCRKCLKNGHFTDCCCPPKGFGGKNRETKKAKVNVLSAENAAPEAPESAVVKAPAAPAVPPAQAATLNSVQQVQGYRFNPDRYLDFVAGNSGWWSIEAVRPIQVQRLWAKMEASSRSEVLGHFIFDNDREAWRRAAPPSHAAKRVCVELDRRSYSGQCRSKVMRRALAIKI